MKKIFGNKKRLRIFVLPTVFFLAFFIGAANARSFEKDWYNMEYEDYLKAPERYSVAEAKIKDFKTYWGKNDAALTYFDVYFTALVEVTYAGGQTETYRVPAANGDKKGDKVKIAYDKRFDEDYETKMKAVDKNDDSTYMSAPRVEHITNTRYSTILIFIDCLAGVALAVFVLYCVKKQDNIY